MTAAPSRNTPSEALEVSKLRAKLRPGARYPAARKAQMRARLQELTAGADQ